MVGIAPKYKIIQCLLHKSEELHGIRYNSNPISYLMKIVDVPPTFSGNLLEEEVTIF